MIQAPGMHLAELNMGHLTTSHLGSPACGGTYLNDARRWHAMGCAQGTAE